jgi:hypothetical protein
MQLLWLLRCPVNELLNPKPAILEGQPGANPRGSEPDLGLNCSPVGVPPIPVE